MSSSTSSSFLASWTTALGVKCFSSGMSYRHHTKCKARMPGWGTLGYMPAVPCMLGRVADSRPHTIEPVLYQHLTGKQGIAGRGGRVTCDWMRIQPCPHHWMRTMVSYISRSNTLGNPLWALNGLLTPCLPSRANRLPITGRKQSGGGVPDQIDTNGPMDCFLS
jgi:hypothetical protein